MTDVTYVPKPGGWVDNTAPDGSPPSPGATDIFATDLTNIETGISAAVGQANLALTTASGSKSADLVTDGAAKVAMTVAERTKLAAVAPGATALVIGTTTGTAADGAALVTEAATARAAEAANAAAVTAEAAARASLDAAVVKLAGAQTITGQKVFATLPQSSGTPSAATDLITKAYADASAQGFVIKTGQTGAKAATTIALPSNTYSANVLTASANGALSVDGQSFTVGDLLVVKDEPGHINDGLYSVTTTGGAGAAWVLTRTVNMDASGEVPGAYAFVNSGTQNANTGWNVPAGTYTVGTTPIVWALFSRVGAITGDGTTTAIAGGVVSVLPGVFDASGAATAAQTAAVADAAGKFPRFDAAQALSSGQKTQAQANLGLGAIATATATAAGDVTGTWPALTVAKINGQSLAALATGLLKNATGTGAPSIATPGTDYLAPNGNGSALTGLTQAQISGLVTALAGKAPLAQALPAGGLAGQRVIKDPSAPTGVRFDDDQHGAEHDAGAPRASRVYADWGIQTQTRFEPGPPHMFTTSFAVTSSGVQFFTRIVPHCDGVISKLGFIVTTVFGSVTQCRMGCYLDDTATESASEMLGASATDLTLPTTLGVKVAALANPVQLWRGIPVFFSLLIAASTVGNIRATGTNEILADVSANASLGPQLSRRLNAQADLVASATTPNDTWGASAKCVPYLFGLV